MRHDRSTVRRLLIRRFLTERRVASQRELQTLLASAGHSVTQATISRDLNELRANRTKDTLGFRYQLEKHLGQDPDTASLRRVMNDYLENLVPSGNLVVIRVAPASAGTVAAAIDGTQIDGVLGTVAGDDTILVVTADSNGGSRIAEKLTRILEG